MTVTYSAEVATSRGFGCFWKLLFRWRGSIYKLLWPDMALYFSFYYFLSILYRCVLEENQKRFFEKVSIYCSAHADLIPISFVLGFYVSLVIKRWWDSFNCIPWPDSLAFFVSAFIHGQYEQLFVYYIQNAERASFSSMVLACLLWFYCISFASFLKDDRGRLMRRTIMRYVNLAFVVTLTCISPCVKKRFPTLDHLVEAGILLPNEKKIIEQMKTTHSTYWMPLVWASSIATRARKEGRIRDDFALKTVIDAIAHYRSLCGGLFNYDWISIPLVYTQVVTLVVYTFFLATLMGRQYLDPSQGYRGYEVDLYIPVFNFLQFFFYMGWLKVAETLVNPFGEDDDDFEVNWVIDRDIQVSYLIVDEMHQEHPELIKDQYWDEEMSGLPYTAAAKPFYTEAPQGSASALIVPPHEAEFVPLDSLLEDSEDEQLGDIKINETHSMPLNASDQRKRLSGRLSESSQSSISGFGRSFHPHSQQRKSVMSLLHRLFSRDHGPLGSNVSLQSGRSKSRRRESSRGSNASQSSNQSIPPSPSEFRGHVHSFVDDIFHLSDLSLAESRATSVAQSPGIFSNMQVTDIFGRFKPERPHRVPLQTQLSQPKSFTPMTPKADGSEDIVRLPSAMKKRRTNSLKLFFRSGGRFIGSQKSLETFNSELPEKTKSPSISSLEHEDTFQATVVPLSESENSINSVPASIFDETECSDPVPKNCSNSCYLDSDLVTQNMTEDPLMRVISSPHVLISSPEEKSPKCLQRGPSTLTLVSNQEMESENEAVLTIQNEKIEKISTPNLSSGKVSFKKYAPFVHNKMFWNVKPKRTASLLIHDKNNPYSTGTGLSKLYGRAKRHSIMNTASQPVTPTESECPFLKSQLKFPKRFFRPKNSMTKENSSAQTSTDSGITASPSKMIICNSNSVIIDKSTVV